jgi:hypothetical protein
MGWLSSTSPSLFIAIFSSIVVRLQRLHIGLTATQCKSKAELLVPRLDGSKLRQVPDHLNELGLF